jgi:hypothetical protein
MAAGTQPVSLLDLRISLLSKVRDVGGTGTNANSVSINDIANSYLNTAVQDININPNVMPYWLHRRGVLITHAPYSTGTVSITAATSRTAVVGSSTLWNTAVTGYGFNNARIGGKMKFAGLNEIYTVSAVGSDTAITLESNYTGADLTAATYVYFEDEYALASDFDKPVDARLFSTDLNIPFIGPMEFRRRYARNDTSGKPRVATLNVLSSSGNTTPRPRLCLQPYPNDEYSIPYDYVTSNRAVSSAGVEQAAMTADTDEPLMPLKYRHVPVAHALSNWLADRKDDLERSLKAQKDYEQLMTRITNDAGIGMKDRPRLIARAGFNGSRRGRRGRYSTNDDFDEMR